jgi:transposase
MNETQTNDTTTTATLHMALELSAKTWLLAFRGGGVKKTRRRVVDAGALDVLAHEISLAKAHFGVPPKARVLSCYEAGRDGFWIHRALTARGVENYVIESSSIEVNRKLRRAKTDALDAESLIRLLQRFDAGEHTAFRSVRVPSEIDEDTRGAHRERTSLKKERQRLRNRIAGLLATQGLGSSMRQLPELLAKNRTGDGRELGAHLAGEIRRIFERWKIANEQLQMLESAQRGTLKEAKVAAVVKVKQLMQLRGVGLQGAWLLVMEFFSWRQFRNRKEVGALAGLCPTPYSSGSSSRDQGISKAGNKRVRCLMIELAHLWLRYQPQSAIAVWFNARYGASKRSRKSGIVAVARKLLIALWHFIDHGVVPAGAIVEVATPRRHAARNSTQIGGVNASDAPALLAG